ncbi:hypothetical protein GSS87_00305 [Corynebacterium sp. 4HC-13]|uniref:hypothetical protein n=1 Tax=Corynebacterium anserum TaxID=2684406 RepID=UPI0016399020|nr:hypothetical protein [Corynebacterium anserum]MBC2680876.1 hypothetical protein [Corynebacterium anserum]
MAQTIDSLLRDSAAAAAAGDTRLSWELINNYAREFWLVDESEIPSDYRGEFYSVRAAAADWLGLSDEAVLALQALEKWTKSNGKHDVALVAAAHLAYQSLNQSEHTVYHLPEAAQLLSDIAERFSQWRPDNDSLTIAEDPKLTWRSVSKQQATALTTAATTAHTVASNIAADPSRIPSPTKNSPGAESPLHGPSQSQHRAQDSVSHHTPSDSGSRHTPHAAIDVSALRDFFRSMVHRFGRNPASSTEEMLWFAQEHWSCGRKDRARDIALDVLRVAETVAPKYEAHFMLGHFAMLDLLDVAEKEQLSEHFDATPQHDAQRLEEQVAVHWGECAELALAMGAPVMALERAELACRMLSSLGKEGETWSLASRMLDATEGIPICPALLNMRAMLAQAAFMAGLHQEAWDNARSIAEWSELTPDVQRTITCYTIATFAGLELGLDEEVLTIQLRRAALYEQCGELISASHILQSVAVAESMEFEEAHSLMSRAYELLDKAASHQYQSRHADEETLVWNRAEWNLTMTHVVLNEREVVAHSRRAAELFRRASDPIKEASAWLTMAGGLIALRLPDDADKAINRATACLPDLDVWLHNVDEDFDPVINELINHYRYILDFRRAQ